MKFKNTPTHNIILLMFLVFIALIFLQKNQILRKLYNLQANNLEKRLINVYGDCGNYSYGFLNEVNNKFVFKHNPIIVNYSVQPNSNWLLHDTSKTYAKKPNIFINYKKKLDLRFIPENNMFVSTMNMQGSSGIKEIIFDVSEPVKINHIIQIFKIIDNNKEIIFEKKINNFIESEIPIGEANSFGEDVSTKHYCELISQKTEYSITINRFKNQDIELSKLYNHKTRFNNQEDLKIYRLMKPGKYIDHPENYDALKLCKYGTKEVKGKVTISGFVDKYYKLHPEKPSRTIVAHLKNDNNGYIHYGSTPRGISIREAARIQSFPDWYKFEGPLGFQFKQIGNAVPPVLSYKLAKILVSFLEDGLNQFLDKYQNKKVF